MRTIGIWGFYFAENFGDDLMALQLAKLVADMGFRPLVFELSPLLGLKYGVSTTADICDFCRQSSTILIGGGNLLAQQHTWPHGPFLKKVSELRIAAEELKKEIHAISIGGDGVPNPTYALEVEQLLCSPAFRSAAVRIKSDVPALELRGIQAVHIPDILWSARLLLAQVMPRSPRSKALIGVHFLKGTPWITNGIERYRRSQWRREMGTGLHFINAFLHYSAGGDYIPEQLGANERAFYGGDPIAVLRSLSDLDCVVSQRLHVGLCAMSFGVPFLSVCAHPKVTAELDQIGWPWRTKYGGWRPRRVLGAGWLGRFLAKELTAENVQAHKREVRQFYEPDALYREYRAHIGACINEQGCCI